MKKFILSACLTILSSNVWANAQFKKVETCVYDYDNYDYCSKSNINKYKKALLTQKPNFDHKYILINVGTKKEFAFVAIDTKTGIIYPLEDKILGFTDEKGWPNGIPPIINYSVKKKDLCIKGSIDAYKRARNNVYVCYSIQNDSVLGIEFDMNDNPEEFHH